MTKPTADPAARTVLDHSMFSADKGSTVGTCTIGTSSSSNAGGELMVNVPMNLWISLIGVSAATYVSNDDYMLPGEQDIP